MEVNNRSALPTTPPLQPSYQFNTVDLTSSSNLSGGWVGVILALSLVSCVGCMCSLFLYHKLNKWRASASVHPLSVVTVRSSDDASDAEELPNYTLVSGLPSYQEALEQLRQANELRRPSATMMLHYSTFNGRILPSRKSVKELLKSNKRQELGDG